MPKNIYVKVKGIRGQDMEIPLRQDVEHAVKHLMDEHRCRLSFFDIVRNLLLAGF